MKNPHLLNDGNWKTLKDVSMNKKFKRKSREPVKRVTEVKSSNNDSKLDDDSSGDPMDSTFALNSQKRLQAIASVVSGEHIGHLGISDTALDMRINALPSISGMVGAAQSQSLSEMASNKDTVQASFPQVVGFDNQQVFSREQSLQSRVLLCQRAERPLSSASQASYMNNNEPSESPRKRLGEASGVVTEIKAIQQTRRLLANARERTRVHTISAAFEALRKQVFSAQVTRHCRVNFTVCIACGVITNSKTDLTIVFQCLFYVFNKQLWIKSELASTMLRPGLHFWIRRST